MSKSKREIPIKLPKTEGKYSKYTVKEVRKLVTEGIDRKGNVIESILPTNDLDNEMRKAFNDYIKEIHGKDRDPSTHGLKWDEIIKGRQPKIDPNDDLIPSKMLKKFQRPYFSPHLNSYEIDLAFFKEDNKMHNYIFCININTRKLYVIPINNKDMYDLKHALNLLLT